MPQGICLLCEQDADLQLSHVVPAFVYRWLRDSSGKGHLRSSANPNLRVQDGPQEYWLCLACEQQFGVYERSFANQIFHPFIKDQSGKLPYGDWMLKFCVSVSWRVLRHHLTRGLRDKVDGPRQAALDKAEEKWRKFLLGQEPHPGDFRQHMLPFDRIERTNTDVPPNINRYITRAIMIDAPYGDESLYIVSKLGRFFIIGVVLEPKPVGWRGTKINANAGVVAPGDYVIPAGWWTYTMRKAVESAKSLASMSELQKDKVEKAFRANADRYSSSDAFHAMKADVDMFGSMAFHAADFVIDDD
jgi:hypothetical protein